MAAVFVAMALAIRPGASRGLWVAGSFCLLLACSADDSPVKEVDAPPAAGDEAPASPAHVTTPQSGAGGAAGAASGGSNQAGRRSVRCTPSLSPDDEFYVPCPDAGTAETPQVPEPLDAATPQAPVDASEPPVPEPDAATAQPDASSDAADEGLCAQRTDDCALGHGATEAGTASCTIAGDFLSVRNRVCEVCGQATDFVDFGIVVMDCGGCTQVYREGGGTRAVPLSAGACTERAWDAILTLTQSDPDCIDVYAYVGSGEASLGGTVTQSSDQVRVCRCARGTGTCSTCVNGACE